MSGGSYCYMFNRIEEEYVGRMFDSQLNEMMKDLVEVLHDLEWWQSCDCDEKRYREKVTKFKKKIWDLIGFSTRFISMESCLEQITNYIVKLERENFGLKEYKKHQEKANERRYHTGDESWHRGSVVAKKK